MSNHHQDRILDLVHHRSKTIKIIAPFPRVEEMNLDEIYVDQCLNEMVHLVILVECKRVVVTKINGRHFVNEIAIMTKTVNHHRLVVDDVIMRSEADEMNEDVTEATEAVVVEVAAVVAIRTREAFPLQVLQAQVAVEREIAPMLHREMHPTLSDDMSHAIFQRI